MGEVVPATAQNVQRAARLLRDGRLVAFPTETVYGLGANAADAQAVARIFAAKGRPADHPLIVHLPSAGHVDDWAVDVPHLARDLATRFWPGPLTLVLRRAPAVPPAVTGGQDTVALRVPAHPVAHGLLQEFGGGLAAPSANRFGRVSPTRARHVHEELGESVALILDGGPSEVGVESTILDLTGERPRLLRPGGIGRDELEAALGVRLAGADAGPRVSGSLPAHYAPASPLRLVASGELPVSSRASVLAIVPQPEGYPGRWLQLPGDAAGYARGLYAALRELDELGEELLVELPPRGSAWEAVHDRLARAARGAGTGVRSAADGRA